MIYLDNAATTFPKPKEVLLRTNEYMKYSCGNPGRSSHKLALRAAEEVYLAREAIAELFSFLYPERVVFTSNATHALNMALKTIVCQSCHVLTSDHEHNSVIRPLERLSRDVGASYSHFSLLGDVYENLKAAKREETRVVVCTLSSNVTGRRCDIESVCRFCSENELQLVLDASQLAGHEKIDLSKIPCSVLCAPGHKALFGFQGSGFAIFCDGESRPSFMEGGSGSDSRSRDMPTLLPERYEAGTLATPSIVSLRAGIEFIRDFGIANVEQHIKMLVGEAADALREIKGVHIYGEENGIICFTADGLSPSRVAEELDRGGICVRAGLHCAPAAHEVIGTLSTGTVRASFSVLNKRSDVKGLVDGVYKIIRGNP